MAYGDPAPSPFGPALAGGLRDLGIGAMPPGVPPPIVPAPVEDPGLLANPLGLSPELQGMLGQQPQQPPPTALEQAMAPMPQPAEPAQNSPDFKVPPTPAPAPGAGAMPVASAAAPPPPAAQAPAVRQPTTAIGQAVAQREAAAEQAVDAVGDATGVAVAQAQAKSDALNEGGKRLAAIAKQQQQFQEEAEKTRAGKLAAVQAANAEVDNAKIDPGRYWKGTSTAKKVGWYISLALSGLGDALQGKSGPNPVIQMLQDAAKEDVQLQMDARAALEKKAGRATADVDAWDRFSVNKDAQFHGRMSQAQTLMAQQVEAAAARFGAPEAMAKGKMAAAELRRGAADSAEKSAQFAAGHDLQKQGLALQGAQFAEQRKQNAFQNKLSLLEVDAREADRERHFALEQMKLAGKDVGTLSKIEETNREVGLRDPATGKFLLNKQGRSMVDRASQIEKEAAKVADPKKKEAMLGEATAMRTEAEFRHVVKDRNAAEAAKNQAALSTSQGMLTLIDGIIEKSKNAGTAVLNSNEMQAKLETELGLLGLEVKDLWTLGSLDEGASRYLNNMTGGDPTKVTTKTFLGSLGIGAESSDKTIAKLQSIASAVERRGMAAATKAGLEPDGFKFRRSDPASRPEAALSQQILKAQTPLELADGQSGGAVNFNLTRNVGRALKSAATGDEYESTEDASRRAAEQSGSLKFPGLSKDAEKPMTALLKQAKASDADGERARAELVQIATNTTSESRSNAVLNVLRDNMPDLYKQAVAKLPDDQRELREGVGKLRDARSAPLDTITSRALGGDIPAQQELVRRATESGDPQALKALNRVISSGASIRNEGSLPPARRPETTPASIDWVTNRAPVTRR